MKRIERKKEVQYCKNKKSKIRAYQCHICAHLDVDDLSDNVFCTCGFAPGCGDPDGCREAFRPVEVPIIGAHI